MALYGRTRRFMPMTLPSFGGLLPGICMHGIDMVNSNNASDPATSRNETKVLDLSFGAMSCKFNNASEI